MRVLDLFSGIGGFSLGLERAGMRTVAFCEIDPFCRRVLAKHWPEVPIYDDIRDLTAERLAADGIAVDVVCGGFPCQDISVAGKGAGIDGARSGLWSEYARLVGELRPGHVIVENVAALLGRGLDRVLGDLAALGYDAEWHCIPASAVGAPHRRDRLWIVAYATNVGARRRQQFQTGSQGARHVADAARNGRIARWAGDAAQEPGRRQLSGSGVEPDVPHAYGTRLALWESFSGDDGEEQPSALRSDWWIVEPDVGRVAHGVPGRVDRLRGLGNAVVPQIPEMIGRAILRAAA